MSPRPSCTSDRAELEEDGIVKERMEGRENMKNCLDWKEVGKSFREEEKEKAVKSDWSFELSEKGKR